MEKKASPEAVSTGCTGDRKGLAEEEDEVASIYCGVGQCKPRFMQVWLESLEVLNCLSVSAAKVCISIVVPVYVYYYYWSLLYSAVLRSRAGK